MSSRYRYWCWVCDRGYEAEVIQARCPVCNGPIEHIDKPGQVVSDAAEFARKRFPEDYFRNHLEQVAEILSVAQPAGGTPDYNLIAAGYLHDILEDTDVTYGELVEKFGEDIANLVNEVTHEGQKDEYGFYFPRLKTRRGIILKFADRLSNLNRMDDPDWDQDRIAQYLRRSKFWKDGTDKK